MTDAKKSAEYAATRDAMNQKRMAIFELRKEIQGLQAQIAPQEVSDYVFQTPDGPRALSSFFGDKDDLIVIHNMGASCSYCTLWADGFNGVYDHLANRAGFVVTSPDSPGAQRRFAESRGWRFPMASTEGGDFAKDMGYFQPEHGPMPGVSAFQRKDGKNYRVSDTPFGPGDDFAGIWHLFELFPEGADGWHPKYRYDG